MSFYSPHPLAPPSSGITAGVAQHRDRVREFGFGLPRPLPLGPRFDPQGRPGGERRLHPREPRRAVREPFRELLEKVGTLGSDSLFVKNVCDV